MSGRFRDQSTLRGGGRDRPIVCEAHRQTPRRTLRRSPPGADRGLAEGSAAAPGLPRRRRASSRGRPGRHLSPAGSRGSRIRTSPSRKRDSAVRSRGAGTRSCPREPPGHSLPWLPGPGVPNGPTRNRRNARTPGGRGPRGSRGASLRVREGKASPLRLCPVSRGPG